MFYKPINLKLMTMINYLILPIWNIEFEISI